MKKNFIIAGILAGIALVCALMIAGVNMFTSKIIAENTAKDELATCKSIFDTYDETKSENVDVSNKSITKKVLAKDSEGNELGYLYTVTGKNSYGVITLMVAIKEEKVYKVEFLENGQSFASTVVSHVKGNYPSSEEDVIYLLIKPEETQQVDSIGNQELIGIDTTCGATYGANLVKELVLIALNDAKGGN